MVERVASRATHLLLSTWARWMNESRELLPFVYGFEKKLTTSYASKAKPIIEKQLVRAGIRLAAVLFRTFKR